MRYIFIIFSFLIYQSVFGQVSKKYRVKKITHYISDSFSVPSINDTSGTKTRETIFFYDKKKLIAVNRHLIGYKNEKKSFEYDSIFYITKDSVKMKSLKKDQVSWKYFKLHDWSKIKSSFVKNNSFSFQSNSSNIEVTRKNSFNNLIYTRHYSDYSEEIKLEYKFDEKGRVTSISETNFEYDTEGWRSYKYLENADFSVSNGSGSYYHGKTFYRFNKNNLICFIGGESDTNAGYIIIEYENNQGNASSFYNDITDILYYRPLIK